MTVGSQVKTTFATIKNIEATLDILSNKTTDEQAKETYSNAAQIMTEIIEDLQKQVIYVTKEEPQYKQ